MVHEPPPPAWETATELPATLGRAGQDEALVLLAWSWMLGTAWGCRCQHPHPSLHQARGSFGNSCRMLLPVTGPGLHPGHCLITAFPLPATCQYEGKQFSLGESWLSTNCLLCTCLHPVGVGCCEM